MIYDNRKFKEGFTLIELMVVIFIIGILSAVAIPLMRGRTDATKWSEGKAMAGTIRTAARAYIAERGNGFTFADTSLAQLGFAPGDLSGRYFVDTDCKVVFTDVGVGAPPAYLITVTSSKTGEAPQAPSSIELTDAGAFTEIP